VTVGKRSLAEGMVEFTTRESGETVKVPVADTVDYVRKLIESANV
jgi:Anticodon binding domain